MASFSINKNLLQTRQHFEILDGLRGIAAIAIVIFHFMEIILEYRLNFIGHGFLAVDFFFCLSGFVVAYAYDNRVEKIGFWNFFKLRLIRLHPLIFFGAVLGLIAFILDPFVTYQSLYSAWQKILYFLASVFLIPLNIMPERYYNLFPLNAPAWSLFWEYLANIAFALFLYKFRKNTLMVLTIIGAVILAYVAFTAKNLVGGWSSVNFWDGGARILFSFSMGMLIFRSNWIIKNKIGFIVLGVLLFLTFLTPYKEAWNYLTEPFIIIVIYPLLVSLGAGSTLTKGLRKICNFSGIISYPLYTTHYAIMWLFANYYNTQKPSLELTYWIIVIGTILCIAFAYIVLIVYDIPIRKYLKIQMKKKLRE